MIFLEKIGEIEILQKLYVRTIITKEVAEEYIYPLTKWIEIKDSREKRYEKVLEQTVDKGEASIMVLALETNNSIISIDDLKARKVAKALGLRMTGTLGIIHKAKKAGHIDSMRKAIEKLKRVDFRISDKVEQEIIKLSGE